MSLSAHGKDFWIGQRFHSKDKRELGRHVVIADLRGARAKCHGLIFGEPDRMYKRGSMIALKNLATRWEQCTAESATICAVERDRK